MNKNKPADLQLSFNFDAAEKDSSQIARDVESLFRGGNFKKGFARKAEHFSKKDEGEK